LLHGGSCCCTITYVLLACSKGLRTNSKLQTVLQQPPQVGLPLSNEKDSALLWHWLTAPPPMLSKDCHSAEQRRIAICSRGTAQVGVMLSNAKDLALLAVSIDSMQRRRHSG